MITCSTVTAVIEALRETVAVSQTARLVLDSRRCQVGDVFVAAAGRTVDGRDYFADAVAKGVAAIVFESSLTPAQQEALGGTPAVAVVGLTALLGSLADTWWDHPSRALTVIAITGTNGKTTTTHWLSSALNFLGRPCGSIGTLGVLDSNGVKQPSLLTTPDVLSLHESLAALRDADAAYVVLEASSIGLDQNRLDGVSIDFAVFTNLSREHLDYHGDMDAYAQAKALLFACPGIELALINLDDRRAQQMRAATHDCAVMTYGIQDQSANVRAAHITFEPTGVRFDLLVGRQSAGVQTPIVGDYNLSNLLAVAGVLSHLQIELPDTVRALQNLPAVAGRLERVIAPLASLAPPTDSIDCPYVVVDYAHTPDALESVLSALRPLVQAREGRLWCLVGCGGDRDASKRPLMAQIAQAGADLVVLTSDNPRSESPTQILSQMLAGLSDQQVVQVEVDRAVAILSTIWQAAPRDVVLLAGKGHETWQEVQAVRHPFDDRQWASLALLFKDNPPAIQTDSRRLSADAFFVALRGDNFDGHAFLLQARQAGVIAALVDVPDAAVPLLQIAVGDTRLALQKLATAWRRRFDLPLIAVTGSNGKTTTKEMIAAILRQSVGEAAVLSTQGNLNNEIGVPLTILRLRPTHTCGVVELGMNHPGEIALLASIAQPTIGLVLNAQREHQEFMQSVDAVAQENGEVLASLPAGGVAVFSQEDHYTDYWTAQVPDGVRQITFGLSQAATVSAQSVEHNPLGSHFAMAIDGDSRDIRLSVAGQHNVTNACAAAACAHAAVVARDDIVSGLAAFAAVKGRMQAHRLGAEQVIIDDTYNANPDSVRAAIDVLSFLPGPRALVLGDMGEVGDDGPKMHAEVGAYAKDKSIEYLWTLGEATAHSVQAFGLNGERFEGVQSICDRFEALQPKSVLVKGSRFMAMEKVVQALQKQIVETPHAP